APGEELEVILNGQRLALGPARTVDLKLPVKAGPQTLGAAFLRKSPPGDDDLWQVYAGNSSVQSIAITGPLNAAGAGDTPSREHIFACRPASETEELPCAKKILTKLATRAYRQPPKPADLDTLLSFYDSGRKTGTFEDG